MSFLPILASPWWLLALIVLPWLAWRHHRRPEPAIRYSRLPRAAGRTGWRRHLPFYLRWGALLLLVLALARPQWGDEWEESLTEGIDIQLALDVSVSMAAEDFRPNNRLFVAKRVARDFVQGRTHDRIGVNTFAGGAVTLSPLTTDHRMLDRLLDGITLHDLPDGTAIGVALATAAARLRESSAISRVIVLVTDGVNNSGEIDPLSAAALCRGLGIRVYTVGVGQEGSVSVPVNLGRADGRVDRLTIEAEIDEALLREIAQRTDGQFFRATDPAALRRVFAEIDRLETTPIEVQRFVRYREAFPPLAWSGLLLLLAPLLTTSLGITAKP